MAKSDFLLSIDVDNSTFTITSVETGETQTVELPKAKKSTTTKKTVKKTDDDPTPKIVLEENKYCLNQAAANLLLDKDADENRLEIKYEKQGKVIVPVIGNSQTFGDEGGNKVTKSLTVACRGKANDELSKYGKEFTLVSYKPGIYILNGGETPTEAPEGDENFSIPENDDLDLTGLMSDDNETSADDFDFTL